MRVTFILCTKNGGDRLRTCLQHIEALEADSDLQLLLVDNGSTDQISFKILEDFGKETRFQCRVLQTLTPGNSAGRNVAMREAAGDLVIFTDDDCYVDRDLVTAWIRVFADYPEIGYASGMIRRHTAEQDTLGCIEYEGIKWVEARAFVPNGFIQGSNMAFRRECLVSVGEFDERFGAGTPFAGEEWEVALRVSFLGWKGGYFPDPKVSHDHRRDRSEARQRRIYYLFGAGGVYAKSIYRYRGRNRLTCIRAFAREIWRSGRDIKIQRSMMSGFVTMLRLCRNDAG